MHLRLSEAKSETILEAVVPSRKIKLEFQSDYQNKEWSFDEADLEHGLKEYIIWGVMGRG